jgi:hypothetical protein
LRAKLNPDFARTPPWHFMQWALSRGCISVMKSTAALAVKCPVTRKAMVERVFIYLWRSKVAALWLILRRLVIQGNFEFIYF